MSTATGFAAYAMEFYRMPCTRSRAPASPTQFPSLKVESALQSAPDLSLVHSLGAQRSAGVNRSGQDMARTRLIAFGAALLFVPVAGAKDWQGVMLPDHPTQFIFGYGSLINSASRNSTAGKTVPAIPVRVSA
jgi:hypothetical protein